ncbi:Platelet binding protein GspB [Micromonospora noduli]|nr:Platelet binding protein GspB [Micromonospora noduli]
MPTVTLSRLPLSAPTSPAKRAETATGTGPGSGKAVATRVRAASSAPPRSTVAAIRSVVPVGVADTVTVGSLNLLGTGGADVAVQSDPSVGVSADPAGGTVSVTATATRPPTESAVTGRATATRRSPSAVAQAGSRNCWPSSGTAGPVQDVRRPVASCSISRGVTASGVSPAVVPVRTSGAPAGTARPVTRVRGASVAPTSAHPLSLSSRPRSSASARVVSTATRRGASPAPPSHWPTAVPRLRAGLTAPAVAALTMAPSPATGAVLRVSARSVPTESAAWSRCDWCHVSSKARPKVPAAQASPTSSPAATACGRRAASETASGSASPWARYASRSAPRRAGSTTRRARAAPAVSSSAGASTRTASARGLAAVGWAYSCHHPAAANTASIRSPPDRASSSRRVRWSPAAGTGRIARTMRTAASTSAPPTTARTWAPAMAGRTVRPAPSSGGRWVRPACRADEAGIASAAATAATSPASSVAVAASWPRLVPRADRTAVSSARMPVVSRPARTSAVAARTPPRTATASTTAAVTCRWSSAARRVSGSSEATRASRTRSPRVPASRPSAPSTAAATVSRSWRLLWDRSGWAVTSSRSTVAPVVTRSARSTRNGP